MLSEINMDYRIIWDNNVILDLLLLRTDKNPYIERIENIFVENNIPIFLSSSQLHNVKFILSRHLKRNNIPVSANEILDKFFKTHIVKILKTPSYIDVNKLTSDLDVESELIRLTAEAFGLYVLTRDRDFLKLLSDRGISPENLESFLEKNKRSRISMLDLTAETLYQYRDIEKGMDGVIRKSDFILGDEVEQLEEKIADYIGTKYAVGVSSGTDALVLSLRALAIKNKKAEFFDKEDLIITTPFTFTATGEAILRAGATPLFVDIDIDTYNIDPEQVEKAVRKYGSKVKGIIPVHLYGQPCNMDEIMRIAKEYDLFVVEDCAQSFGAKWDGKQTGSFGDTGCFSFFPSKNLGGFGDGGMITTNDEKLYELLLMLRKHGGKDKYNVDYIGYNARLDTIQAAVILAKLSYVDELIGRRRQIASIYNKAFRDITWIITPKVCDKAFHTYHQYTIRVEKKNRYNIQKMMRKLGVDTAIYYPIVLDKMPLFKRVRAKTLGGLMNSEFASMSVLSFPIEPMYVFKLRELIAKMVSIFSRS